jgi:hypothetical protein
VAIEFESHVCDTGGTGVFGTSDGSKHITMTVGAGGANAGDLLVLGVASGAFPTGPLASVTDSQGNSWTAAKVATPTTFHQVEIWACRPAKALVNGDTIVLTTFAVGDSYQAGVDEFSGFTGPPGYVIDVSNSTMLQGPTAPVAACSVTTTHSPDLVYCVIGSDGDPIDIVATGMTLGFMPLTGFNCGHFEWIIRTTPGTNSTSDGAPTFTSTTDQDIAVVAFSGSTLGVPGNFGGTKSGFPAGIS